MSPTLRFVPAMYAAALSGRKTQTRRVITPQPTEGCGLLPGPCELYHPAIECKGMFEPGPEVYGIATEDEGWVATYGPPGTTLPIVTTWAIAREWNSLQPCIMDPEVITSEHPIWFNDGTAKPTWAGKSRPAMFFPKSLYHLARQARVTAVKAERVQSISESDASAEGIQNIPCFGFSGPRDSALWHNYLFETAHPRRDVVVTDDKHRIRAFNSPVQSYRTLWDSINSTRGKGERKGCYAWDKNPWVFATTFELV